MPMITNTTISNTMKRATLATPFRVPNTIDLSQFKTEAMRNHLPGCAAEQPQMRLIWGEYRHKPIGWACLGRKLALRLAGSQHSNGRRKHPIRLPSPSRGDPDRAGDKAAS